MRSARNSRKVRAPVPSSCNRRLNRNDQLMPCRSELSTKMRRQDTAEAFSKPSLRNRLATRVIAVAALMVASIHRRMLGRSSQILQVMPTTTVSSIIAAKLPRCVSAKRRSSSWSKARSSPVADVSFSRTARNSELTRRRRATVSGSAPRPRWMISGVRSVIVPCRRSRASHGVRACPKRVNVRMQLNLQLSFLRSTRRCDD